MPISAIIVLSSLAGLVLILAVTIVSIRMYRRHSFLHRLFKRGNDHVHYAFIINPSKPNAKRLKGRIRKYCAEKGLKDITFINTELDKDGRACALQALDDGADVIVAVGGDGTVRTVASALAGTCHAMGIIPIGTGNLFARNLGIPIDDIDSALAVATSHGSRFVDVGRLEMLDSEEDNDAHAFLIIAGTGFDALMIDNTDPTLKKNISWLAYFVSGAQHLFAKKYTGTVTITGADGQTRTQESIVFRTLMAGNCGQIPGLSLMPEASWNDGLLDFEIIDTSGGIIGWANLFGDVLHQTITHKAEQSPLSTNSKVEQLQGLSAEITLDKAAPVQVDGDVLGETSHIRFSVEQEALCVRVPDFPQE
ncbi:MAG: diacylglycerol kinase family protein [Bifidobacterium aquikefiri]|uniref:DeoR family transcriptional regulator n=1 Tax=Bifidobacterium aquikefiri TaxID=1653207 RepID=A0A261G2T5_9BIFI|nr:diacylglycerol kinase family protein [Bifidobacterium aquikefiri]OZG65747.1 DeoR family transcriptional regulator [Bifidobacterium aquikefiri]